ncbi:hypothetical protein HPP92_002350 [Vanilla planifolia]|uniref:Protein kinase domain-containing protein n=1 Tax=Vanilla planifolia TaxID=51239 RepID=A0A835SEI2_VANPL|nr:hypothetical protein HPP92_002350 [Vanilla planifolia]
MAAGRRGVYREHEVRDKEYDVEMAVRKRDYHGDGVRGHIRDRVSMKKMGAREKESLNGHYPSSLPANLNESGKIRSSFPRRCVEREPGELSSESGSDEPDVPAFQVKENGLHKSEGDASAARKRKFSPIIWDRDDDSRLAAVSSGSRREPVKPADLPLVPPTNLPRSVELMLQAEQALPLGVNVSEVSCLEQQEVLCDVEPGLFERGEDDVFPARLISTSRWAESNNDSEEKEAEALERVSEKKKKKNTPMSGLTEQHQSQKKLSSVENGEVVFMEGSEDVGFQPPSGIIAHSGDDEQHTLVDDKNYVDVVAGEAEDDACTHTLNSIPGNGNAKARTLDAKQPLQRSINMLLGCRSVDEFERLNKIDEGTYGIVYRAKDKKTGEIVALKRVKMEKEREGFPLTSLREINILLSLHHQSIVDVKEVVVGSSLDSIFMVMEYMEHDLKGLMETMKQPFSQSEVKCLMLQLLCGVKYLHDNWVLHRDLKTSNLLLNNRGELKICDFGLARQYGSPLKQYTHLVVTLWYRAPELLLGSKEYSTAIDMWSLGCIMAEFLAKEPLFNGKTEFDQLDKIFRTLGTPNEKIWPGFAKLPGVKVNFVRQPYNRLREKFPPTSFSGRPTLSEAGFDLLNKLLTYDPEKRITAEAALNHDWFREVPLPKEKDFMPTFPAQHAQDRRLRRILKSPDPLEEQRKKELNQSTFDDVDGLIIYSFNHEANFLQAILFLISNEHRQFVLVQPGS